MSREYHRLSDGPRDVVRKEYVTQVTNRENQELLSQGARSNRVAV